MPAPDVKVLMPIFSSAGLSCAVAAPCPIASAAAIAHNVFSFIVSPGCSCGAFCGARWLPSDRAEANELQCANGPTVRTFRFLEAWVLRNGSEPRAQSCPPYGLRDDQASRCCARERAVNAAPPVLGAACLSANSGRKTAQQTGMSRSTRPTLHLPRMREVVHGSSRSYCVRAAPCSLLGSVCCACRLRRRLRRDSAGGGSPGAPA